MILKKPYAFIIKHFRIIHLLLLIPMIYLVLETKDIVTFFSEYIANGYRFNSSLVLETLASNYINIFMYLAVIIILIVSIVMSGILQKKDKPTRYYNISIVYYTFIFLLITASFSIFKLIETDMLDDVMARLIKDLSYIIHLSQYIFIVFTLIRGVGFNIKKFNFKSDLQDLEITSEDNEEFEFLVGMDTYKTKRTIRRFIRELKYYYKENKFIFRCIFVILIVILGTSIYMNREVYQKVYKEQEIIAFGYLSFSVKDTFISNISLNGETIDKDKTYVIVNLEINNRYREDKEFNYSDLELVINKKYISPNITLGNYFKDFGNPYNGSLIKGNTTNTYVLVYEIDKYLVNNDFYISAYSNYDSTPGGIGLISKNIDIKPTTIASNTLVNKVNKGTNLNFKNTNLKDTKISILNSSLTNRFEYNYKYCINDNNCYDLLDAITTDFDKTLMVLDYKLELDKSSPYMYSNKNYKTFFTDFLKIKYTIDGRDYYVNAKIKNTNNYDEKLILEVPQVVNNASNIEVIITIRNVSYSIKI